MTSGDPAVERTAASRPASADPLTAAPDPSRQPPVHVPVRIGRQGIYDAERELAAYELLFRAHGGLHAGLTSEREQEKATSQVISATFGDFGVEQIAGDLPLFINLTRSFFTGDLPIPCEPGQVVLELLEDILVDDEVIAGVRALAGRGYRIAVDDFAGEEHRWPAVRLADYVKIDISQTGDRFPDVLRLARGLNPDAPIVVERVEDEETFDACRDQGVDLYQGYLLQRPVVLESVSLSPSQVICLKLVRALTGDEAPIEEIERLVASDPGMSVRVLRTVRSAAVGTSRQITSLRQAIALLGRRQLCSWVVLMLLGGVTRSDPEALTLVLARATACARLVEPGGQVDVAYTVGLLSGVARVLRISDEELIETTGVAPVVRAALLNHEGPAGRALAAVLGYEDEDLPRVSGAGHELYEVSRAYLAALSGAMATVSLVTRGSAA